ncbi:MAG: hypothetical protein GY796_24460 [Chloroflexi bacterium]|nr:hypothetical protein [Chloroflexota bacterium]
MLNQMKQPQKTLILGLLLMLIFTAACNSSGGREPSADESETMSEMDHEEMDQEDEDEMEHEEMEGMEHDNDNHDGVNRIPNLDGAAIRIVSPTGGDSFKAGEQILVEVEVENFKLGEGDKHWHIYIDGSSWGMVMGENRDQPISGLEPGEHEIAVYLSIQTHEEYMDGDQIMITVEE